MPNTKKQFKRIFLIPILIAVLGLGVFLFIGTAWADTITAKKWQVVEIPLISTASTSYSNAYAQVEVAATFTKGTITKTVKGFWDGKVAGKDTFKVRFTPTLEGIWSYSIVSTTHSGDTGLSQAGTINVSGTDIVNSKGFLRVDPNYPTTFIYDDGTRYFMFGTTIYSIIHNAMDNGPWKQDLNYFSSKGVNKVRMLIHTFDWNYVNPPGDTMKYPDAQPFTGTSANPDHDRLNIAFWQKLDEVVEYMASKGINIELIFFSNGHSTAPNRMFGTDIQDKRYVRYAISRYAAYPNIFFDPINEYDTLTNPANRRTKSWWNQIGYIAYNEDPWHYEESKRRPLSIHSWNEIEFDFFNQIWPSYVILQYNGQACYGCSYAISNIPDVWGYDGIVHNLRNDVNMGNKMPVVNDEYGYAGGIVNNNGNGGTFCQQEWPHTGCYAYDRGMNRQTMWSIYVAGGYATMGDSYLEGKNNIEQMNDPNPPHGIPGGWIMKGWQPWLTGDAVLTDPVGLYNDAKRLIDFFTTKGIEYWKMASYNNLITSGNRVYVLAIPGVDYVVYNAIGTTFSINLQSGNEYTVFRFDPRTGSETQIGTVSNPTVPYPITSPAGGNDWVYRIKAGGIIAPEITSPVPGSVLSGATETFTWTNNGLSVSEWWLWLGTTQGGKEILNTGSLGTTTSYIANGLPTDGSAIWVRLHYKIGASWQTVDFQYTASGNNNRFDVNNNGFVDSIDIQLCVNVILGIETDSVVIARAKAVAEPLSSCDVLDLQAIVNEILK